MYKSMAGRGQTNVKLFLYNDSGIILKPHFTKPAGACGVIDLQDERCDWNLNHRCEVTSKVHNKLKNLLRKKEIDSKIHLKLLRAGTAVQLQLRGEPVAHLIKTIGPTLTTEIKLFLSTDYDPMDGWEELEEPRVKLGRILVQATIPNCCPGEVPFPMLEGVYTDIAEFERLFGDGEAYSTSVSVCFKGILTNEQTAGWGTSDVSTSSAAEKFNRKILTEQCQTDTEIVAANGTKIGCHNIFLSANSDVLAAMLANESFVEGKEKCIVMKDMSEVGVRSMLSFLYYGDVEAASADFDICLELLEAAEKYGMESLKMEIQNVMLDDKDFVWFNVEGALRLFCFARNANDCEKSKDLATRVLKKKYAELKELDSFKRIFCKSPDVAMDLTNSIIQLTEKRDRKPTCNSENARVNLGPDSLVIKPLL